MGYIGSFNSLRRPLVPPRVPQTRRLPSLRGPIYRLTPSPPSQSVASLPALVSPSRPRFLPFVTHPSTSQEQGDPITACLAHSFSATQSYPKTRPPSRNGAFAIWPLLACPALSTRPQALQSPAPRPRGERLPLAFPPSPQHSSSRARAAPLPAKTPPGLAARHVWLKPLVGPVRHG